MKCPGLALSFALASNPFEAAATPCQLALAFDTEVKNELHIHATLVSCSHLYISQHAAYSLVAVVCITDGQVWGMRRPRVCYFNHHSSTFSTITVIFQAERPKPGSSIREVPIYVGSL